MSPPSRRLRAELPPRLRREARSAESSYGMADARLNARRLLGDRVAGREPATLAFSPRWRRQRLGEVGFTGLVERYGAEAIVAGPGGDRPEDRASTSAKRRPSRRRPGSCSRCTGSPRPREHSHARRAPGRPRAEIPGPDEEPRRAIVHEYGPGCERSNDPRWRLEALCTEPSRALTRRNGAAGALGDVPRPRPSAPLRPPVVPHTPHRQVHHMLDTTPGSTPWCLPGSCPTTPSWSISPCRCATSSPDWRRQNCRATRNSSSPSSPSGPRPRPRSDHGTYRLGSSPKLTRRAGSPEGRQPATSHRPGERASSPAPARTIRAG